MATRRKVPQAGQLTLFDIGLDTPTEDRRDVARTIPLNRTPKLPEEKIGPVITIAPHRVEVQSPEPKEPSPFERASYELYLRLKGETYGLAKTTGVLVIVLVAVVFLGVQIPEAGFGFFKVGSLKRHILVGLIGWLTFLSGGYTLIRAAFMMRKKVDCGLFYQRVLEFSSNPAIRFAHRFLDVLFVAVFVGILVLTWIVAGTEMVNLIDFIVRELIMMRDPWRATIKPSR